MIYSFSVNKDNIQILTDSFSFKYINYTDSNFKYNNKLLEKYGNTTCIFLINLLLETRVNMSLFFCNPFNIQFNITNFIKHTDISSMCFAINIKDLQYPLK